MHTAHRRLDRYTVMFAGALLAGGSLLAAPFVDRSVANAEPAAEQPRAVIVVGPVEGATSQYRLEARQIADQLRSYGASVRQIVSPWATWAKVKEATAGANLLIYLGHGRGNPGPYGAFDSRTMNGLGLNHSGGHGDGNVTYYGEYFLQRSLGLAKDAVVILEHVPYAAGSSEPGRANPGARTAMLRADNYAAGFLHSGAAAVYASDRSVATIIRDLFRSRLTMQSIFWNSPWTSTRYDTTFPAKRTAGASGIVAPYSPGRYYQSVVGRLRWTATDWRGTWSARSSAPTGSVRVTSVAALLTALANNATTDIVVANGTYHVSTAASQASDSLWIGGPLRGPDEAGHRPRRDARRGDLLGWRGDHLRRAQLRGRRPRPDLGRLRVRRRPAHPDRGDHLRRLSPGWPPRTTSRCATSACPARSARPRPAPPTAGSTSARPSAARTTS